MKNTGRKYYKIGEVAKIVGVQPYVLRFWEREFPHIKTIRTKGKQRLYPRETVKTIIQIKKLLYEEGLTIEGARKKLKERERYLKAIEGIKKELIDIKRILRDK